MPSLHILFLLGLIQSSCHENNDIKDDINFLLYTRDNINPYFIRVNDLKSLNNSNFNPNRRSIVVIHGFMDCIRLARWLTVIRQNLLRHGNYNVIIVDWSKLNYDAYVEVVGRVEQIGKEVANLIKFLQESAEADPRNFHIIGHSLGAHVSGFAGKSIPNIGRITGLDPAGPKFQNILSNRRLDKSDALFVDIIHTDAAFNIENGFGTPEVIGHVDFFPNNGNNQPNCYMDIILSILNGDWARGMGNLLFCNHLRVLDYFISSIDNNDCHYTGISCPDWQSFQDGLCGDCDNNHCAEMGFHAEKIKDKYTNEKPNRFYLKMADTAPFCLHQYQLTLELYHPRNKSVLTSGLYLTLNGSQGEYVISLANGFNSLRPDVPYTFLVTSETDLGTVDSLKFRWINECYADYSKYALLPTTCSSKLYMKRIGISAIKMKKESDLKQRTFCRYPNKAFTSNRNIHLMESAAC